MKKLFVIVFALIPGFAFAVWTPYVRSVDRQNSYFIELSSIKKVNNFKRAWILMDKRVADEFGSSSNKQLVEIDCVQSRIRMISFISYSSNMGNGNVISSFNPNDAWDYASPGDINDFTVKAVCSH